MPSPATPFARTTWSGSARVNAQRENRGRDSGKKGLYKTLRLLLHHPPPLEVERCAAIARARSTICLGVRGTSGSVPRILRRFPQKLRHERLATTRRRIAHSAALRLTPVNPSQ
jgi:hypothetical protein